MTDLIQVQGAGGRTGTKAFQYMKENPDQFLPKGLVRSKKSSNVLKTIGADDDDIIFGDITSTDDLTHAMEGMDAVILLTSAVPKIKPWSIVSMMLKKLTFRKPSKPEFYFPEGASPEEIDWLGAKNQIDVAVASGIKHFVFVGSMGGTTPENMLNEFGRNADGSNGNILMWKRKAERYLIDSGLTYTIIHPSGLIDTEPGLRKLIVNVDDVLLNTDRRNIPRADVGRLCAEALKDTQIRNIAFDTTSLPEGEGEPTTDFSTLFKTLNGRSCSYSIDENFVDPPSLLNHNNDDKVSANSPTDVTKIAVETQ